MYNLPRKPEIIKEEILDLEKSTQSSRDWLIIHPDDKVVQEIINQSNKRKQILIAELEESLVFYRHNYIKYALKTKSAIAVKILSQHLKSFNDVINKTASSIAKKDIEIELFFDTVFQSSFGILLSTDYEDDLLGGLTAEAFEKFYDIITTIEKNGSNIEMSHFNDDKKLLRTYRKFFKNLSNTEYPIDIKYGNLRGKEIHSCSLTKDDTVKYYNDLAKFESEERETYEMNGSIQGISLLDKNIQFVPFKKAGSRLKIYFTENQEERLKELLGAEVSLVFEEVTSYDETKDKIEIKKHLISVNNL